MKIHINSEKNKNPDFERQTRLLGVPELLWKHVNPVSSFPNVVASRRRDSPSSRKMHIGKVRPELRFLLLCLPETENFAQTSQIDLVRQKIVSNKASCSGLEVPAIKSIVYGLL